MNAAYRLADPTHLPSPSLIVYPELIRANIARVIAMAGGPERLRPHAKTHKTREIARMLLEAGVQRHKCATIAEAEMLASAGAPDVLVAYPLVGPNPRRLATLASKFPDTSFSTLIDHADAAHALSVALVQAEVKAGVLLDLDVGQHRTGIAIGADALALYALAASLPGLVPNGFHAYDGHNNQAGRGEREAGARAAIESVLALRAHAEAQGLPVPRLVCGGTPGFPAYAAMRDVVGLECSPGTFVLHDAGYGPKYADLADITPAAVLLARVVSRPTAGRITLDLGSKAVAPDLQLTERVLLLDFPQYRIVGQSEEHLVVETAEAEGLKPGDVIYALPGHVCPTVALHRELLVAQDGQIAGTWMVAARDRALTV